MAKPLAAEVIIADFHHELRFERLPLARAFVRPAARSPLDYKAG
jgi:hypothetical protein